jgi:hypothetical protein
MTKQREYVQVHIRRDWTIDEPPYGEHQAIDQLIKLAERAGSHFFEPATMRFFRSRIDSDTWAGADGWYWVSSEQFHTSDGQRHPRRYTVRRLFYRLNPEGQAIDIDIDEIGEFQQYPTLARARTAARKAAKAGKGIDHGA